MNIEHELHQHFLEDKKNFKNINDTLSTQNVILATQEGDHVEFRRDLAEIKAFMESLKGVEEFFKGAGLLKRPMMIFVGFIIALVAVMGGLRTIIGWFVTR